MLCLEHIFSAHPQTVCMWPLTWWDHLAETDQATWFGAWSAAAAFLGGLAVYWHSKRIALADEERRREISRRAQSAHIAGLLLGPVEKLEQLSKIRPPFGQYFVDALEIPNVDDMQDAVTDPYAFDGHQGAEFVAFVATLRKINRHIRENAVGELVSSSSIPSEEVSSSYAWAKKQSDRMWAIALGREKRARS